MRNATGPKTPALAWLVQQFFTEYLVAQRALSPCTVACYRDALMLFLGFAGRRLGKEPSALRVVDIQPCLLYTSALRVRHHRGQGGQRLRAVQQEVEVLDQTGLGRLGVILEAVLALH